MFGTRGQRFAPFAFGVATAVALAGGLQESSRAQSFTEFPIPTPSSSPALITAGPDGNLWFTEEDGDNIGRITTAGVVTEFNLDKPLGIPSGFQINPIGITAGLDGRVWFTEGNGNAVGQLTTNLAFSESALSASSFLFAVASGPDGFMWVTDDNLGNLVQFGLAGGEVSFPSGVSTPAVITGGPDGRLWFTSLDDPNGIRRADPFALAAGQSNAITDFSIPTVNGGPAGITAGPDGAVWFTETNSNKVGRITTNGVVTDEFSIPTSDSQPGLIVVGPDGALWFTEGNANNLGRITTTGALTEFPLPVPASAGLGGIAAGSDGALWFTEFNSNRIDRFVPPASATALVSAILPSSRSMLTINGAFGNFTITAFATLINADTKTATSCILAPVTTVPATFAFQTTDPATNAVTGSSNAPVDIPAGKAQTFLISFTALKDVTFTPTFTAIDVVIGFSCANEPAAPINPGVNTLLLSGSLMPVPDIVALAASGDPGIVDIPGANGAGDFAVATVNVGASGTITASADTGGVTLPVTVTLCETDPESGACISAVGPSVSTTINTNATPTFGIFVAGDGTVPFSPAVNRIFVRFKDQNGVIRGSTSVAVRTQ